MCGHNTCITQMTTQVISENETVLRNTPDAATPLDAFWGEHRLLHKKDQLREFLGVESLEDLADVHPGDLRTRSAVQWAEGVLTVAEANRLARAVARFHAERPPPPEYGPQWYPTQGGLPGGAANVCRNNV